MKLSLAVQTTETPNRSPISLLSGSLDEMARKAADWGADGVELMPVDVSQLDAGEIAATFARQRLEICAVGTALFAILGGMTLLDPDAEKSERAQQRLQDAIHFAAAIGAPLLTIGGFRGRFSAFGAEGRRKFIEILRRAGDLAAQESVRIVLEPINRYQSDGIASAADGLNFLAELDHDLVGLLIDTCHMTMEEFILDGALPPALGGWQALARPPGGEQPPAARERAGGFRRRPRGAQRAGLRPPPDAGSLRQAGPRHGCPPGSRSYSWLARRRLRDNHL